jgi:hypothetical protein
MEHPERLFPMSVEARWLGGANKDQLAAGPWLFLREGWAGRGEGRRDSEAGEDGQ